MNLARSTSLRHQLRKIRRQWVIDGCRLRLRWLLRPLFTGKDSRDKPFAINFGLYPRNMKELFKVNSKKRPNTSVSVLAETSPSQLPLGVNSDKSDDDDFFTKDFEVFIMSDTEGNTIPNAA
ncbi:hypothetical protein BV898_17636 [Hypsibius exemplaris]|uniref:Uncharacterized protein n=1 Tax=Hypsibius exemplaris TaxID=2072580 RepID=A0A9X6NHL3_HYPEX|nr:hypothetical protein BV898_17636 [Hypsibius exemplaris]